MSDATRQKVLKVLGDMTKEQASTWMDEVRSTPQYKYTAPWHYADAEKGERYQPAAGGDVVTALNTAYKELQHMDTLSPERLRFDVLVLFHLCGDLMQPLHDGYASDKGGNDYQVQYNGKGTNLHHIWDSEIIESQGITMDSFPDSVKTPAAATLRRLGLVQVNFNSMWNLGRVFLAAVYNFRGHKLDNSYLQKNKRNVEGLLQTGGTLLAICLEQTFGKAKNIPVDAAVGTKPQTKHDTTYQQVLILRIRDEDVAEMVGKLVHVCSRVYSVKYQEEGGVTLINMGGEYPNQLFTVVIMAKDRGNFDYKPEETLSRKVICITGEVKEYKGKPEIVVEHKEQIQVQ